MHHPSLTRITINLLAGAYTKHRHPSSSTSTSSSSISDGFTCDASLMVENETLKKEVNELTRALGKAYGGEDR